MDLRTEAFRWALACWTVALYLAAGALTYLAGGLDPVVALAG